MQLRRRAENAYKYDIMTGLFTRNGFYKEFERIVRTGGFDTLTLVLCDLDGLKYINDNFSHIDGDNAITVTARALANACKDALCAKYGGDELLAVITGECDPQRIKADINGYLDRYNAASGKKYKVSASVGIYTAHEEEDFNSMFSKADELMYAEKSKKKAAR